MGTPDISVIIPTHRRRDLLDELLVRLDSVSDPILEVIVIDDASSDGTADMLREKHSQVRVVRNDTPRGFDALPDAIALARGEIVLELDDDAYPAPETLTRVLEHFRRRGASLGLVALPFVDPVSGRRMNTTYYPDMPPGAEYAPAPGFVAGAVAVRREAARSIPLSPPGYFMQSTEPPALIEYLNAGWEADFLATAPVFHTWAGRERNISFGSAYLPFRNDIVTFKRYYRGWRRSEMLIGRYLTGLVHLTAARRPGAWWRALRDADRLLATLPARNVDREVLDRVYRCFAGTTLLSFFWRINFRRLGWFLGVVPVDQIG